MNAIEIVPYDPNWPLEYERIAADVRAALGALAMRVDHIGSTSVPGLAAKDVIDVQVSVANFAPPLAAAFASIGYILVPEIQSDHIPPMAVGVGSAVTLAGGDWEKRYFQPRPEQRNTHMHVRILGRANQRYALLFRDYLRTHPSAAAGYEALKRVLAEFHREDRLAYTTIKDPVCDIIMSAAEDWAIATGWAGWM
jgi:GrpB-like predicted nucleotidyltransferase (UPF0157 family)